MRRFVIFCCALIAFTGSLTTVFVTQAARDANLRGYVDATQTTDLPYRIPRLGVNADLRQYQDDATLNQHLTWMQQAHITWVRQFVYWPEIEPQPDAYQWQTLDRLINAVDEAGLQFVPVFMNTPTWARPNPDADIATTPPDDPTHLADFVRAFAARYANQVDYYQIWDEPNLDDTWGLNNPNPAHYAALLQAAYTAIHSADPQATVIAAALAPTTERNGANISDILYLEDLYQLGASDFMDAVAAKPYGFDHSPNDRTVTPDVLNFSRIIALRDVMQAYGDGRKALWASHWGWNSLPDNWGGEPSIWGATTHQQRIDYTLQALQRAEREWPWLGGMILHHWQPDAPPDDPQWGFALIGQDGQPTQLWEALVLRPRPAAAYNGLYHPRTPYARYSGVWTFSDLGADIGWLETSDSQLAFEFSGQAVAIMVREGDYFAFLYPTIDGQPANATPRDNAGNAYILLRSATTDPTLSTIPIARDLPDGTHTLRIVTDRGRDQWAIAGYAVSDGDLAHPYNQQMAIAWFATLCAGLAVLITGRAVKWQPILKPIRGFLKPIGNTGQFGISFATSIALMVGMLLTWGDGLPALFRRDMVQYTLAIALSGGLLALEPGLILTLIATLVLFVIIYNRLLIGLTLTLLWSPFFLFPVELYLFAFPTAELIILITTAAWLLNLMVKWGRWRQTVPLNLRHLSLQLKPLDWGVLAWVALGIMSLLWAERTGVAITELRTLIIEPALFYAILRTINTTRRDLAMLVGALVAAGVLVALIGLVLFVQGQAIITAEAGARRLASVYGSPNNVGLFLGRCLPFALAYLLHTRTPPARLIAGAAFAIMLVAVALTQSVGALLFGVPAGLAAVIWLTGKQRAILPLTALAALGIAAIGLLTRISARFASLLDLTSGTNFIRLRVWESTIEMIAERPLTGFGLDQFLYAYRGHYIRPDAIYDPDLSHPHNVILDFWTRLGILGVLLFIWMQVVFWRSAWHIYRHQAGWLIIGTMGSMTALLAHGLIDNSVYVNDLAFIFVFLLGIVVTLPNTQSDDAEKSTFNP